ncbi:hypothetical protein SHIRM173S_01255 [Streptomyces hirsutus]
MRSPPSSVGWIRWNGSRRTSTSRARAFDAGPHQVDEIGSAAEVAGIGVGVEQGDRARDVVGAPVVELPSCGGLLGGLGTSAAARVTASTIET